MPSADVDLCVIGAGPAGIATAVAAARAGVSTLLVDRGHFPRGKVCGGCLNRRATRILDRLGLAGTLANAPTTTRFRLGMDRRQFDMPIPAGTAISRLAWDEAMIGAARDAGVEVRTGTSAKLRAESCETPLRTVSLTPTTPGEVSETTVRSRLVVAADGLTQSATRTERELRTQTAAGSRIGAGCLIQSTDGDGDRFPIGTIFMSAADTGYVGLVRVESNRLNVAAAIDTQAARSQSLAEATAAIVRQSGWDVPAGWDTADWTGTPPLTRSVAAPVAWRVASVGDAAGYVEPFTGEGMAWALAAGESFGLRARDWIDAPGAMQRQWPALFRRVVAKRRGVCRALAFTLKRPALCRLLFPFAGTLARPATYLMNRA